jgi:hypothetical protein
MARLASFDPVPAPKTIAAMAYQTAPGGNVGNVVKSGRTPTRPDRTMDTGVISFPNDQR